MEIKDFEKHIFTSILKPLFKSEGFLVSGNHWRKNESGFVKIIHFQRSQFNSKENFQLFVNLGLFFPNAFKLRYTSDFYAGEIPDTQKKPSVHDCVFKIRGKELFQRNREYLFSKGDDRKLFQKMIEEDVKNDYLLFFNNLQSIEDCERFFKEYFHTPKFQYEIALGLAREGEKAEARSRLEALITKENPSQRFMEILNQELKLLNIDGFILTKEEEDKNITDGLNRGSYP